MKNTTWKSIGAILAGFALGAMLSIGMDSLLETNGIMKTKPFDANSPGLIIAVIIYRTVFNISGCYLAARLAPEKPMKHAMIIGIAGLMLSILGTIAMWDNPPHYYPIILDILALPSAWLGGKLAEKRIHSTKINHQ